MQPHYSVKSVTMIGDPSGSTPVQQRRDDIRHGDPRHATGQQQENYIIVLNFKMKIPIKT